MSSNRKFVSAPNLVHCPSKLHRVSDLPVLKLVIYSTHTPHDEQPHPIMMLAVPSLSNSNEPSPQQSYFYALPPHFVRVYKELYIVSQFSSPHSKP